MDFKLPNKMINVDKDIGLHGSKVSGVSCKISCIKQLGRSGLYPWGRL